MTDPNYVQQHATLVSIHNPSGDAPLIISLQGRQAPEMTRHFEFVEDSRVGEIRPRANSSIGGGQIRWSRRFVLSADRPTSVLVTSRSSNFEAQELKRSGDVWKETRELPPAREGVTYELDANTRVAVSIDQNDETLDDAYINLRQVGDANIAIIQQERRAVYRRTRAASWLAPAIAGSIAPGGSREFTLNDNSRLLVETTSAEPIELCVSNTNKLHMLHLLAVDKNGERIVSVVPPRAAVDTGQWVNGGLNAGRVTVDKNTAAAVAQAPQ